MKPLSSCATSTERGSELYSVPSLRTEKRWKRVRPIFSPDHIWQKELGTQALEVPRNASRRTEYVDVPQSDPWATAKGGR